MGLGLPVGVPVEGAGVDRRSLAAEDLLEIISEPSTQFGIIN